MTYFYPKGLAAAFAGDVDWANDDIRVALVMENTTADDPDAEFVADIATLDECDAAGYARTAVVGMALDVDTAAKIVSLLADQTDMPAFSAATRRNVAAIVYQHNGADSTNRLLVFVDTAPWFPFDAVGTPVRFRWGDAGIVRFPCEL